MAMRSAAARRLTVEEFLTWESGGDTRYELIGGVPVAMAPPSRAHRLIATNLTLAVGGALSRRPGCTVEQEAGVGAVHDATGTLYQADLAVTCTPHRPGQQAIPDPILIVEILSPSTERHDRRTKLPDYRALPSVQEIVLIDQAQPFVEIHRRAGEDQWLTELLRGTDAVLRLDSAGLALSLATLYANVAFEDDPARSGGG